MSRILLTGASGLIGSRLIAALEARGDEVVQLVRREPTGPGQFQWDPYAGTIDDRALKGLDAVISLSGAGVGDKRWTDRYRKTLVDSRIVTTRFLSERLAGLGEKPDVFISQSATGIYGDRQNELLTEESTASTADFLARLTIDWEAAADPAREAGIRVIHPRTGIVLDRGSQLVKKLLPLFRLGV
ncbi:MAG: NAD-dependent epimerase/dehydratase family protein, partial [Acidimicrobiia bacterium]|nr:NAD-dependent epimerase/dehydratase family protein [Acidimicrobiia bacterium]